MKESEQLPEQPNSDSSIKVKNLLIHNELKDEVEILVTEIDGIVHLTIRRGKW